MKIQVDCRVYQELKLRWFFPDLKKGLVFIPPSINVLLKSQNVTAKAKPGTKTKTSAKQEDVDGFSELDDGDDIAGNGDADGGGGGGGGGLVGIIGSLSGVSGVRARS